MNKDGRQHFPVLKSALNPQSPTYLANREKQEERLEKVQAALAESRQGGGERATPDTRAGGNFCPGSASNISWIETRISLNCARSLDTESEGPQPAEASWAVSDKSRAWTV